MSDPIMSYPLGEGEPLPAITITGPITIRVLCITITIPAITLPAGLPERMMGMILDRCSHPAPDEALALLLPGAIEAAGRVPPAT